MRKYICLLLLLAALAAVRMFSYSLGVREGRIVLLPESVQAMTSFNNCLQFQQDAGNPMRFILSENYTGDGCLRFAIPDFDPSLCKLVIRLKARPALLKQSKIRSARNTWDGVMVQGDVATYDISMADASSFLWSDGKCYVGVLFPRSSLRSGDVVELLDFKFSLR